jgi:hypothetical protein
MKERRTDRRRAWVLLITEGLTIAFPPELYSARSQALGEGQRWADALASIVGAGASTPWLGRWEIGDLWISVVEEDLPASTDIPWVGTCWTPHGHPDPEALILGSQAQARRWVREPIDGAEPSGRTSSATSELAFFRARSGEYIVEAHRAKVVQPPGSAEDLLV